MERVYGDEICLLYALSFYLSVKLTPIYVRADRTRIHPQSLRGYLGGNPTRRSACFRARIHEISACALLVHRGVPYHWTGARRSLDSNLASLAQEKIKAPA